MNLWAVYMVYMYKWNKTTYFYLIIHSLSQKNITATPINNEIFGGNNILYDEKIDPLIQLILLANWRDSIAIRINEIKFFILNCTMCENYIKHD